MPCRRLTSRPRQRSALGSQVSAVKFRRTSAGRCGATTCRGYSTRVVGVASDVSGLLSRLLRQPALRLPGGLSVSAFSPAGSRVILFLIPTGRRWVYGLY